MARVFEQSTPDALYADVAVVAAPPFTISILYYIFDVTARHCMIGVADKDADDGQNARIVANGALAGDLLNAVHRGSTSFGLADTGIAYTANVWQHACAIFTSASSRTIYINGGNSGSNGTAVGTTTLLDRTFIGAWFDSDLENGTDGYLAEAAIWDVALTAAEVLMLSKRFSPKLIRPQSLVFHPQLIRDADIDLVGGITLSISGAPGVIDHPRMFYAA